MLHQPNLESAESETPVKKKKLVAFAIKPTSFIAKEILHLSRFVLFCEYIKTCYDSGE